MQTFSAFLGTRLAVAVVAAGVTILLLPLILRVAHRWGIFDTEGPLKIHTRQIPRLGGIAIMAGMLAGVSLTQSGRPTGLCLVLLGVWGVGAVDDVRGLPPILRLLVQLAAGTALWAVGWSIPLFANPLLGLVATCVFVAAFINAFNFLDGADGVAASVALVIALAYGFLPVHDLSAAGAAVAAALAGSCAGFLLFNFPPAKIFMGDSGSTLLGLSIAFLSLDFWKRQAGGNSGFILPLLVAALPLLDLGMAVIRRIRKHASPFAGDRQHFYDLLLQRGWPARRVAIICALATALLAAGGWIGIHAPLAAGLLTLTAGIASLAATLVCLGSLRAE